MKPSHQTDPVQARWISWPSVPRAHTLTTGSCEFSADQPDQCPARSTFS
jgi:hypothetical protein